IVTSLACSSLLSLSPFLFKWFCSNRDLHSFPTRRSSDLYHGSCSTAAVVGKINRSVPCDFYVAVQSAALHGHVKVARDGTVYLRSEEHTSELQSRVELVCRLLLENKKKKSKHAKIQNKDL